MLALKGLGYWLLFASALTAKLMMLWEYSIAEGLLVGGIVFAAGAAAIIALLVAILVRDQ